MGKFSDILLTVDYDRTLTAPDATIPERNLRAVWYFMENGGTFTLNTGRSVPMCRPFLNTVPTNAPLLLYNGSGNYNRETGTFSDCVPIALDPTALVSDLMTRFPTLRVEQQGKDAHYLFQKDAGWEAFSENNHCTWAYASVEDVPQPFLKLAVYGQFREPTMASMYAATDAEMELFSQVMAYVKAAYGEYVEVLRSCPRIIDIHAKGVSKKRSAQELRRKLGKKILVCVGDGENDLSMLDGADYAFCPADGVVADRYPNVCSCADGAVADVIYKKIPEILGELA